MTENEQRPEGAPEPRVYKANQVHKRKAGRKPALRSGAPETEPSQDASQVDPQPTEPQTADPEAGQVESPDYPSPAAEGAPDVARVLDAHPAPRRSVGRIVGKVIGGVAAIALVACASWFAWNQWGRFNDWADMQGDWFVEGTATPVQIDEAAIHLDENLQYEYRIDDHDKTISYSFANWEGQGRYRFSDDRQHLIIYDGEFDGVENTVDDLIQLFGRAGLDAQLPEGDGIIVFSRQADQQALAQRQAAERAKRAQEQDDGQDAGGDAEGAPEDAE